MSTASSSKLRTATRIPPRGGNAAARWHPYHVAKSTPTICSTQPGTFPSPRTYLNTPVSSLLSTSDIFRGTPHNQGKSHQSFTTNHYLQHKERHDVKKAQKENFENALKDLAVQRISDIWKETSYVIHSGGGTKDSENTQGKILSEYAAEQIFTHQLPSPSTPSTETFTSPQSNTDELKCNTHDYNPGPILPVPRRIPLRAFVHEVLRRSKTMWPALQVALCYLDAIRPKVPTAIAEAEQGEGLQAAEAVLDSLFGSSLSSKTSKATNGSIQSHPQQPLTPETHVSSPGSSNGDLMSNQLVPVGKVGALEASDNIPQGPAVAPVDVRGQGGRCDFTRRRRVPVPPAAPLPPRPSPLLCPRRMFVAALILATKFTQDRVYSNRAWAKISGLDAREVSRCERALGEALEWRLWVGKGLADEPTAFLRKFLLAEETLAAAKDKNTNRATELTRSMSESALFINETPPVDLSSALKRSSSLNSADFGTSGKIETYHTTMLNDPSTLILTPANADLDAMNTEPTPSLHDSSCLTPTSSFFSSSSSSSFIMDNNTPTSSFTAFNKFSFTPAIRHGGMATPSFSEYSPSASSASHHFLDLWTNNTNTDLDPYSKQQPASASPWPGPLNYYPDPSMRFSLGIEGTFDIIGEDADQF